MKQSVKNYKRIVVKIGSSLLFTADDRPDERRFQSLVAQIESLKETGREVVIVSSGAIALGMSVLGITRRPRDLSRLQAAASVGQHYLMGHYSRYFGERRLTCGQILLTWEDFNDRSRYVNARHTLTTLLQLGVIPIINENDTVSTDEIKFGDNDRLSALVATLSGADLLIILSDVAGLLDRDRKTLVRVVEEISPAIRALACPTNKKNCVGGMVTKLDAARIAVDSGIPCIIANGRQEAILNDLVDSPEPPGTLFVPKKTLDARKRWIAFGSRPRGGVMVDNGAQRALLSKKSLLSVGIVGVNGEFEEDDVVSITDRDGTEFARGKVALSSKQLEKVMGKRYPKEIIHCDNIVAL